VTHGPEPIDLRGLDPPLPLLRVLDALREARTRGEPVLFLLPRSPEILYAMLRRDGWRFRGRPVEGGYELTVFRDPAEP
jgi:hypothetical protein